MDTPENLPNEQELEVAEPTDGQETLEPAEGEFTIRFHLPGTWYTISMDDEERARKSIDELAREVAGDTDEGAKVRALMKHQLQEATKKGIEGGGRVMYLGREIAPEVPFPVSITVYEPQGLRMSPAVGTDPQSVLGFMQQGLEQATIDEITPLSGRQFHALRTVNVEEDEDLIEARAAEPDNPELAELKLHTLRADYWCHVPTTKNVILVSFSTQMSEVRNMLLMLFDAIVSAAYFVDSQEKPLPRAE